jgi:tetratricopeptide (TPR) repeat protein
MTETPCPAEATHAARWQTAITAGELAQRQGRLGAAEQEYRTALQIAEQFGSKDERLVTSLWALGKIRHAQKQHAEGEQLRRRALEIQDARLGPDDPRVAELLSQLAFDCSNMGKPADGVPFMERALSIAERTFGREHEAVANRLTDLAILFNNTGRLTEAEAALRRAVAIYNCGGQPDDFRTADTLEHLAHLAARQGKLGEAEELYKRVLVLRERCEGPEGFHVGRLVEQMSRFHAQHLGRMAEAEQLSRRALAIYEKIHGADSNQALLCRHNLAGMCHARGLWAEAEAMLKENIRLSEQAQVRDYFIVPQRMNRANDLSLLAAFYTDQNRYAEAEPLLQRALAMKEEALGAEHLHIGWLLEQYGRFLRAAGRDTDAVEIEARARQIIGRSGYRGCCGIGTQTPG